MPKAHQFGVAIFAAATCTISAMIDPCAATSLSPPRSRNMTFGAPALPPLAYVEFCRTFAGECVFTPSQTPADLTDDLWRLLVIVNNVVNGAIRSIHEPAGRDEWHLGAREGDCDEFVVEKRHQLIAAGFPAYALSFTEVKDAGGNGHLVLTVHTNRGAYVLDNMRLAVLPWASTGYQFVKTSSLEVPGEWVEITIPSPSLMSGGHAK